jgi:nucleoside-diphosphate-sugar epimerase
MMKILVTGCNGQVGHSLVKNLEPRHGLDISLFAFDRE